MTGYVHSFQSLGASDGPGVRFVVFAAGCPLRCAFCHNPDTWDKNAGKQYTAEEIVEKAAKYRSYYGKNGGLTFSGGEPLMQAGFVAEVFKLCKRSGISTALDTSGCILNDDVLNALNFTDTVLLDYKMAENTAYKKYIGCEKSTVDSFLKVLNEKKISTWIRRVIICNVNDDEKSTKQLFRLEKKYSCITKTELLPFKKYCIEKYKELNIAFPFESMEETPKSVIEKLYETGRA